MFPNESDEYRSARDVPLGGEVPGAAGRLWSSELYFVPNDPGQHPRHVDFLWPLWAVLDRTPDGRGSDWEPLLDYH